MTFFSIAEAFQHVRENLIEELNGKDGANETDLVFLKGLLDSPAVTQLIKVPIQLSKPSEVHRSTLKSCASAIETILFTKYVKHSP